MLLPLLLAVLVLWGPVRAGQGLVTAHAAPQGAAQVLAGAEALAAQQSRSMAAPVPAADDDDAGHLPQPAARAPCKGAGAGAILSDLRAPRPSRDPFRARGPPQDTV